MDSVSRAEFHAIFDRVSADIDLGGCTNALLIEYQLLQVREKCKAKSKMRKTPAGRARYGRRAEWLDTLIENDFAGRAIFEARMNPRGLIGLTLRYGKKEAERILAQRRVEQRTRLRAVRFPRPLIVPKRIPELRRVPTFRRRTREQP